MPAKIIGLIAHAGKPGVTGIVKTLADEFARKAVTLKIETGTAGLIGLESTLTTRDLGGSCDILLVLGGDGTILRVVHDLGDRIKPIFGLNLGALGFLTCLSSVDYLKAVECLLEGSYTLSQRTLLDVTVLRDGKILAQRRGLNDAVISRGELSRLIKLQARIDGAVLTEYNADGLVISTPTGSTAYSLSAGGPILTPDSGVFVITPICPHVLTNRSVIVNDRSEIEISPRPGQDVVFLTVDGQELVAIEPGDTIRIRKSPHELPLATLPGITFSEVLCQKLKWSGSAV
jgi:NAD+ kinase